MQKPIEEVVGDNVMRLRKAAGWSQRKLSERADVSQRVISNIEQGGGAGSSSIGTLQSISVALGIPTFLIMTEGLSVDKAKIERMAKVMQAFSGLSDHAQERILDIVEDYKKIVP
jgi:transcriptional regulator with XRE-family HTH domain